MGALDGLPPKTAAAAANAADDGTSRRRGRGRRERGDAVAQPGVPDPPRSETIPKHVLDRFKDRRAGAETADEASHAGLPAGFRGRRGVRPADATRRHRATPGPSVRSRNPPPSPAFAVPPPRCWRPPRTPTRCGRGGGARRAAGWDPSECAVCAGTADVAFTRETLRCARCATRAPSVLRTAVRGGGGRDGCVGCAATRRETAESEHARRARRAATTPPAR